MNDAPPDGEERQDEEERPARGRPALVLAISIAVVLAIASAALAVVAARRDDGQAREDSLRRSASAVGTALLSYDYHDPSAHRKAVLALSTGSFRNEYQQAFDQGLGQLITKVKATSVGTVKDVYVSQVDDDGGQAIVVADVTTKGASGTHTLYDVYVLLTFVDAKGTWKVDDVTDLNFAQADAALGGTTSTTTPVP
jgi:hypothetical protein